MADWTNNADQIMEQQRASAAGFVLWSTFLTAVAAAVIAPALLTRDGPILARGTSLAALALGILCSLFIWLSDQIDGYPYHWLHHKEQSIAKRARREFRRAALTKVVESNDRYLNRLRAIASVQAIVLVVGLSASLGWIYR